MYRELIESLTRNNQWVKLLPPQTEENIRAAEAAVGYAFPEELRALYRETDGDSWFIFSLEQLEKTVRNNREIYLPFFEENYSRDEYFDLVDRFIFFATNGCGDYYGYRVSPDGIADASTIFLWEHEYLGERCWKPVASSIGELIRRYYHDEI